ncbi:MAG: hypothetical protein J5494_06185, partial [Candidatus Methanomethylophilaceae archaeon]|nr:hypothetical protein [Candidatus Methanomethylophilaceae archaeon]
MLEKISAFVRGKDKAFFRELAYRVLDAMDDKLKKVYIREKYDNFSWIAAVTMLFPKEISKQIPFITYTGSPDRCFHKLAGIFDEDPSPMVSVFTLSSDKFKESGRDDLFDSYVDNAYAESSDRERFFAFLSRTGWNSIGKDIINMYHLFSVCEKGFVPSPGDSRKSFAALRSVIRSATDSDIVSVYSVMKDVMDAEAADFFGNEAVPAMKDKEAADRILAEVTAFSLEPSRSLKDVRSVISSYEDHSDEVRKCISLKSFDLLDYPAGRYYCLREYVASGDPELAGALQGFDLDGLSAEAAAADGKTCAEALKNSFPLKPSSKEMLKETVIGSAGTLPGDALISLFGLAI